MKRGVCVVAVLATAAAVTGTACSNSDSGSTASTSASATSTSAAATSTAAASGSSAASAAPVGADQLQALVPTPANTQVTKGPDSLAEGGMHLFFKVDGSPNDVMTAYKAALEGKGWTVTTMVTSGGGDGGGATYTGTNGGAYGVFDGGGYNTNTYLDVCTWPTKPASPNCSRGSR